MGYKFDKTALNNERQMLDMTVEDMAFNMEISNSHMMKLLYSKKVAQTISDKLLRKLSELGISETDIGVDRRYPGRRRGRPRKNTK